VSRTIALAGVLVVGGVLVSLAAGRSTHEFEGHTFSLELPQGFSLQADASPQPGFGTFGFATDPRHDGTRGLIQVTLADLSKSSRGETITVAQFATVMIDGVRRRRSRWELTESDVHVGGIAAKRLAWSGSTEPGFGRPPVNMRGVMIVGIAKDLGFSLHVQDVATFADTTLQLGEQALLTFAVTPKR
jgi:hypothetical protein